MSDKLAEAIQFAAEVHEGQFRDDGVTPFIVHPMRTMVNLETVVNVTDEDVLCAGVLHDVIEDGPEGTADEVFEKFGGKVSRLVEEVSFNGFYEDKTDYMLRLMEKGSLDAVTLKLCDRLDNVRDMREWKPGRQARYIEQTRAMVEAASRRVGVSVELVAALRGVVDGWKGT